MGCDRSFCHFPITFEWVRPNLSHVLSLVPAGSLLRSQFWNTLSRVTSLFLEPRRLPPPPPGTHPRPVESLSAFS